jgi:hypothetical protein
MRIDLLAATCCCAVLVCAQQIPPPLVVEGVPDVPAELVKELTPCQNIRSAQLNSWHATKREMLIGTRFGEARQVHALTMPGGARTQ